MVCVRHLFLDNLSTRTHKLFVSTTLFWINRRDDNWGQHSIIHNSISYIFCAIYIYNNSYLFLKVGPNQDHNHLGSCVYRGLQGMPLKFWHKQVVMKLISIQMS